jgi:hypothetical protein
VPTPTPPQPGDRIVVLYREGESKYGMEAVFGTVTASTGTVGLAAPSFVWFRAGEGKILCRQLDEEGIEWARVTDVQAEAAMWIDAVLVLEAARRLAGTDE